ncbi:MAG: CYTH domain-containing protein [Bacillota bacterium]|nr:CYTH domain-containing protein [Bacillota bacterium]
METELKLNASRLADPTDVIRNPWISDLIMPDSGQSINMDSHYFDTADGVLRNCGCSLRLRTENEKRIVTVKAGNSAGGGLHQRMEWSAELDEDETDLLSAAGLDVAWLLRTAVSDGDPVDQLYDILQMVNGKPLLEICRVTFTRLVYDIGYGGTLMELALDEGGLYAADRMAPICEFELELKEGDARDLVELGQELLARYDLEPENRSKLARCLALTGLE